MTDTLTYIEAYFLDQLSGTEKLAFEKRCEADEAFAGEVAFYIAARQSIKVELLKQKQADWQTTTVRTLPVANARRNILSQPWLRYAAAASVILVASLFFLLQPADTKTLAEQYINQHYTHLSLSMGNTGDSIELAKDTYNKKEYDKAAVIFESIAKSHPDNAEVKEYAGISYLHKENFDKALQFFEDLSNMKGLYSNPGVFFKAITLMMRSNNGDAQNAKQLLEQVVREKLERSDDAGKLLSKF